MKKELLERNFVAIHGEVVSDFELDHTVKSEKFYRFNVSAGRRSNTKDVLTVVSSERYINPNESLKGKLVSIEGQFRSYNKKIEDKTNLVLFVFVKTIDVVNELPEDVSHNYVYLEGRLCKEPNYRKTPMGREITDVFLAVNRLYGRSDYIPCILWSRDARWAKLWRVGECFALKGRIQSREYDKTLEDGKVEKRIAYEVSVFKADRAEDEEESENASEEKIAETA